MTLPRTGLGTTSLGAVGGPRGVAAGALRIFIEFITQYDPKAVKQLDADLATVESAQNRLAKSQITNESALANAAQRRAQAENVLAAAIKNTADRTVRADLERRRRGIEAGLLAGGPQRVTARANLQTLANDLRNIGALTNAQANDVARLTKLRATETGFLTRQKTLSESISNTTKEQNALLSARQRFTNLAQGLPSRLGGLAVGALGGLVGGAVVGVAFQAAQAGIDLVGEAIQNLIDPARHAREEIGNLTEQVRALANEKQISQLQALTEVLAQMGIVVDAGTAGQLSQAMAVQEANKSLESRGKIIDIISNTEALRTKGIKDLEQQNIRQAYAEGKVVEVQQNLVGGINTYIDGVSTLATATADYDAILKRLTQTESEDIGLKNQQRAATFALQLAQQNLNAAAQAYVGSRTSAIDAQIEGLRGRDPTSARTRALQARLDAAQSGAGGRGNAAQLAKNAEERALILLRQRLRLLGQNINLEQYSGKFLLEAINAKEKALQREAAAQDRLNKLLDIRYRMSQVIRREEGETIGDFLERRAQENRDILSDQRDLERDAIKEGLDDLKDRTEDEVRLKELAEERKTLLAEQGAKDRNKALQEELRKSQQADRDALQARIKVLEAQKVALQKAADDALKISTIEHTAELENYIRVSRTMADLAKLAGEVRGLEQAKSFLKAMLDSGVLTPEEYAEVRNALARVTKTLNYATFRSNQIQYGARNAIQIEKERRNQANSVAGYGYASGGMIPLTNASSPFGQNFRFGEQGSEAAMIFSNKMVKAMRDNRNGFGDLHFYGVPSDDRYNWAYKIESVIRDVIRDELRG